MSLIRIERNPSRCQLNLFGLIWLLFFAYIGWKCRRLDWNAAAVVVWSAAAVVPAVGWLVPEWMRRVYVGAMLVTWPIGLVVSHALLAMVYYVVLTPIGLALRLCGHDPMGRKIDREASTYWTARQPGRPSDDYFHQY